MAISSGDRVLTFSLSAGGQSFLITHGTVTQTGTHQSAEFTAEIPMSEGGAFEALASPDSASATVTVLGTDLINGQIDEARFLMVERVISVKGRDKSASLHAMKSSEKWTNKTTTDIVKDLAGRAGLGTSIDQGMLQAGRVIKDEFAKLTDGVSFGSVIQKLAELDGARWWVKGNTLHYVLKDSPGGSYQLNYSFSGGHVVSDCLQLTVERNYEAAKTTKVIVQSWNTRKKLLYKGNASAQGSGGTNNYSYHVPGWPQDHVDQFAKSRAAEHARHKVTVYAHVVGDPSIDISMGLQLSGTGAFDDSYIIDSIHHDFGMSGYTMDITARSMPQVSGGGGS